MHTTEPLSRLDWLGATLSVTVLMRHTVHLAAGGIGLTLTAPEATALAAALRRSRAGGGASCCGLTVNGHHAALHTSVMGERLFLVSGPFLFSIDPAAGALLADCLDEAVRLIAAAVTHEEAACSTV